jgi:hypothetical protein
MKDFIPFPSSYVHSATPHIHFSHLSDTCNLGSNGFTKLKESMLSLIPFWRAALTLVPECYALSLSGVK